MPSMEHAGSNGSSGEVKINMPALTKDISLGDLQRRGMTITFQNLEYVVVSNSSKKEKVSLLSGICGYFSSGQMVALMGPSGSGKTTMLDVLAGRKTQGEIKGTLEFGGVRPTLEFLRRYTGYVEQFDTLLGTLSVYEMLLYTAELKCSIKEPLASKADRCEELIEKLGLGPCRNTRIGSALERGISGGQAKRVNIGIALVTNPRILFLDEPTSGLDSYTANEVMLVVKQLVTKDITVVSTIHSPSPYTFRLFDRLVILLRGKVVYMGERGEQALEYFRSSVPDAEPMKEGSNEAEWIVDITTQADRRGKAAEFAADYAKSELKRENDAELVELTKMRSNISPETLKELSVKRATVTPFWWALKTLIKYRTTSNYRNPEFLGPRIGDKLIFSLLVMTLYWKVGKDLSSGNLVNISAVLFMWCTLPAFGAAAYVPSLVLERSLFIRERNDGLYLVITYLCAKMVDELMLAFFASIIFSLLVYFPLHLAGTWVNFWLTYFCTLSNGIVLAYFIAAMSPNMDVANAALPTYVVTLLFFAGFLLTYEKIPNYWKWYANIDLLKYAWGSLMINQFGSHRYLEFNGTPILEYYALAGASKWLWLLFEWFFFVFFFICSFLALQYRRHEKR